MFLLKKKNIEIQLCFQQCRDDLDIQNEGKTYESVVRQFCELTASASSTTTSSPQPPPVTPTVNQSLATTFFAPTGNSTSSSSGSSVPTTTTTTKTTSNANKLSLSNCDVFSFLVSWLHCDDLNIKKSRPHPDIRIVVAPPIFNAPVHTVETSKVKIGQANLLIEHL
ncbi:6975_t:CDS:2 [Entrophospora sp. SA101]|nr:6975_t:CDS:2 [Entrophospora sp. SA101]